jgi:hypothetical protein
VHWQDGWTLAPEPSGPKGGLFYKAFIGRLGDRFILNHGVVQPHGWQDTLRFYESHDLREWRYLGSHMPDPRWYAPQGRWDAMYLLPKDGADPFRGCYGYITATPKPGLPRGCGMCETEDGIHWTILPPPVFDWADVRSDDLEIGGVERLGGKYVLIGGVLLNGREAANANGYSLYTFVADDPRGPFRIVRGAHRLCGNMTAVTDPAGHLWRCSQLAAWARGRDGELLISNYAQSLTGTWLLPLRKPVFADGIFRLGWWEQNKRLKGRELPLPAASARLDAPGTARTAERLALTPDPHAGLLLEGTLAVRPAGGADAAVGFAFPGRAGSSLDVRLETGRPGQRATRLGWWLTDRGFEALDIVGPGCASVAGVDAGAPHAFRLLVRQGLFELYVNDLLVQTYFLNEHRDGTLALLAVGATAEFTHLRAWQMTIGDR